MPVDHYDPVRQSENTTSWKSRSGHSVDAGMGTRLRWALFPLLSATLFLADITTSFCYSIFLFVHADDYTVRIHTLPYNTWGALIIVITYVSSFIINIIATLDR